MNRPTTKRVPAALLIAAFASTLMLGACKPGDGASGVNPPSGTQSSDQAPPARPRQP